MSVDDGNDKGECKNERDDSEHCVRREEGHDFESTNGRKSVVVEIVVECEQAR